MKSEQTSVVINASGFQMKRLTEQLRASHPNAAHVRLRRALSKKGVQIFQLVGVLQGGQKIARKLDASDELGALVAAQQMMSTVGEAGLISTGRVSPAGQLKMIQRIALQSIENRRSVRSGARKPIREATKRNLGLPDYAGSGIHASYAQH